MFATFRRPHIVFAGVLLGVAVLAACGDDTTGGDDAGAPAAGVQPPAAEPTGDADPPGPSITDRKIVRTATLSLSVDDIAASAHDLSIIARSVGGYVADSEVRGDVAADGRAQSGTISIRVPASAFDDTLDQIRGLARSVRSENTDASEVTEEYSDLQARLRNLQAAETQYVSLLTQAASVTDIITVQEKIDSVRLEVEQAQGRLNVLTDITDLATITVLLALPPASGEGQSWVTAAWEASWAAAGIAVVVLGTLAIGLTVSLLWVAPLVLVAAFVWRRFRPQFRAIGRWFS